MYYIVILLYKVYFSVLDQIGFFLKKTDKMGYMADLDASKNCVTISEAAEHWEPLKAFVHNGKIDLGDPASLLEYNRAILHKLTGFTLEVPAGNLIPSICLRATYVRAITEFTTGVKRVIDIGTGATAIIALLAAHKGYEVTATEVDPRSLEYAKRNAEKNHLDIQFLISKGSILTGVLPEEEKGRIDLCMTYPPFYPNDKPGFTSKKKRGFGGTDSELFGGISGIEFSERYVEECAFFRVKYCTLIVHKQIYSEQIEKKLLNFGYSTKVVKIQAGRRSRYLLIGKLS